MKRILVLISVLAVIGLLIIPSGVAFADQTYHTERLPLHSVDPDYPLRNGMVVNIHANGPNNAAIEHYMLNGAKPNTTYEICRVWAEDLYLGDPYPPGTYLPAGWPTDTGYSIQTDKNGNGHCQIKLTPEYLAPILTRTFHPKFVLMVGGHLEGGIFWFGGTPVYETVPTLAQLD
jgi:hypothetical protein